MSHVTPLIEKKRTSRGERVDTPRFIPKKRGNENPHRKKRLLKRPEKIEG